MITYRKRKLWSTKTHIRIFDFLSSLFSFSYSLFDGKKSTPYVRIRTISAYKGSESIIRQIFLGYKIFFYSRDMRFITALKHRPYSLFFFYVCEVSREAHQFSNKKKMILRYCNIHRKIVWFNPIDIDRCRHTSITDTYNDWP